MQLVIHAPFGGRINRAWGLALRKRFCRSFDFELQAAATDDGIVLSLGPQHSFPLETVFSMLRADDVEELLIQAALQAPMFETRWRWNATRSLALLRSRGRQARAAALQRMRAEDLLAAVFPGQTACQDNHGGGADRDPRPPAGARDRARLPGRGDGRRGPARGARGAAPTAASPRRARAPGAVGVRARDPERQPVRVPRRRAAGGAPHARGGAAPRAARRPSSSASAGSIRRPIAAVVAEAQPDPRDADELHDLLLDLGALPEAIGRERGWADLFDALVASRRAARLDGDAASTGSPPSGARSRPRSGPSAASPPTWSSRRRGGPRRPTATARWSRSCAATLALAGPTTAEALAARLGVRPSDVDAALARLEMEGAVAARPLRRSTRADEATQWCDRRLLARINRRMLDGLRREIEPVSAADCLRFLFGWQHVRPGQPAARPARPGARDRPAAGLRGGGRRVGARDPAGARGRLRPGLARRALPVGRRHLGTARRAARGRHAQPRGADRARAPRRPALAARARRRTRPRRRGAVAGRARRARASWRAPAPASSTRSSPARAACAPRSRTRWASWSPPAGSPATASRACAR